MIYIYTYLSVYLFILKMCGNHFRNNHTTRNELYYPIFILLIIIMRI